MELSWLLPRRTVVNRSADRGASSVIRSFIQRMTLLARTSFRAEYYAHWRAQPVQKNSVLYESFAGNGMLCNPEAIFRYLHQNPEFGEFTHIWALAHLSARDTVTDEFAGDRSVRFVEVDSLAYLRALATSGYLVNNATFGPEFSKRPGQVYVNTWHGTPLKKMGFDIGGAATRVANVLRNLISADYLLAPNRFTLEKLYEGAHRLTEIYPGAVVIEGYPRVDQQFAGADTVRRTRLRMLGDAGRLDDRKIILYAPTWKGTSFDDPVDDIAELMRRMEELEAGIDTERFVVLLKTHQIVHRFAAGISGLQARLVSNDIPANAVLATTDILITDYSSIFFDFLATGRPIVFFAPDLADYAGYRGLYIEPERWPGPVVETIAEVLRELHALERGGADRPGLDNYRLLREQLCAKDDGGATARVVDVVFRGHDTRHAVIRTARSGRTRILINAGSMRPNDITSSLLSLLDSIDHSRFDVSVVFSFSRNRVVVDRQREINPEVRQFVRVGIMNGSRFDQAVRLVAWKRGDLQNHRTNPRQRQLWNDEWSRCFGLAEFDFVIDFSGYGPLSAILMLHAPSASKSIWLHNEMMADSARVADDRGNPLSSLNGIFSLYRDYDHLVSVSPLLSEINRHSLSAFAPIEQFSSARNTVNAARIRAKSELDLHSVVADPRTGAVPEWASRVQDRGDDGADFTFVSLGRLSVEKNLPRVVRAFARVRARYPLSQLIIIGDGPERKRIEALIVSLDLQSCVFLAGFVSNPFPVLSRCDCLVVASDHDGAPTVIAEARVLGLAIVAVEFASARDSVPPEAGIIVEQSDEALAAGMEEMLAIGSRPAPFDPTEYNQRAIGDFYSAIGFRGDPGALAGRL